ncbi:MAG: fused MFS/spermidine synthase [Burkholderiales bacterium]|nr:fused MFS/spermidine synthase [Flavobacterium sp.]
MLKRLLSYFMPITIYSKRSKVSKNLEISWNKGKLVLDSENTNYSYGSLQQILRKGLQHIGFETIKTMDNILILGVAGGSVIKTLVDEIQYKGQITGVEIDAEIIQIAKDYFRLNEIQNLEIVIEDAFTFVLKTKKQYDLIVIDIFQDTVMPNFLFETFFMNSIEIILKPCGAILFNTMILNQKQNQRNEKFLGDLDAQSFTIEKIPRIEEHNELIVIKKIEIKKRIPN